MRTTFLAVFFLLFLIGCTGDIQEPIFSVPNEISVVTPEEVRGKTGFPFEFSSVDDSVADNNVAEVTLQIRAAGISSAPFFITVRHRADDTVGGAIRMLNTAK